MRHVAWGHVDARQGADSARACAPPDRTADPWRHDLRRHGHLDRQDARDAARRPGEGCDRRQALRPGGRRAGGSAAAVGVHRRAPLRAGPRRGRDVVRHQRAGVAARLHRRGHRHGGRVRPARVAGRRERPPVPAGRRVEPAEGRVPRDGFARAPDAARRRDGMGANAGEWPALARPGEAGHRRDRAQRAGTGEARRRHPRRRPRRRRQRHARDAAARSREGRAQRRRGDRAGRGRKKDCRRCGSGRTGDGDRGSGPAASGGVEPLVERGEVHPGRRPGHGDAWAPATATRSCS